MADSMSYKLDLSDLDREGGVSITQQLVDRFSDAIEGGRLEAGAKLPPTRELAAEAGVNHLTAARAYERGGQPSLVNYLAEVEQATGLHARLYDEQGRELSGLAPLPGASELARHTAETRMPFFEPPGERVQLAFPTTTDTGHLYVFVGEFSAPFPPPT